MFTAGAVVGTFANTVQASSGAISGRASVTVVGGPPTSVVLTPNPMTLGAGESQTFTATGRDNAGNAVPVTVDPGGVAPLQMIVNNTNPAGTYTFNGGPIAGDLNKSGAGTIVFATMNLFNSVNSTGGTIETLSHMRYFFERSGGDGSRFCAVTDPGSPLAELAPALPISPVPIRTAPTFPTSLV